MIGGCFNRDLQGDGGLVGCPAAIEAAKIVDQMCKYISECDESEDSTLRKIYCEKGGEYCNRRQERDLQ